MNRFVIAAAAVSLTAIPAHAQVMSAQDYVAAAGAGDLYERESSQIVLSSTADPKLKQFAQTMIAHHTRSTKDVTTAAKAAKIPTMPPKLTPAQAQMIAQLNAQTGKARDMAYVTQQKTAHMQALALHQAYAKDGTAKPLRDAATSIVPVVQHHIEMLKTM